MSDSERICSMFANPTKSGGTYFSGKLMGDKPFVVQPGQRICLVKSSKVASNGSPVWSLLLDPPGADDHNRVLENRSDVDLSVRSQAARSTGDFAKLDDDVPF